ncbi:heavy-metal-associated domain-containing protein [Mycobacterium genavense]|uniref:heavy-metal-associated domain-containing protein n=1 Tax=Mycobacterium genavense TaxID=36812 RepID=UPI003CCBEA3C
MTELGVPEAEISANRRIELDVDGMSCGACARRVEGKLNKIDGVHASVDFVSRVATIEADRAVGVSEFRDAVHSAGYRAELRTESGDRVVHQKPGPLRGVVAFIALLTRWLISPLHR